MPRARAADLSPAETAALRRGYFLKQPPRTRKQLEAFRRLVRKTVPAAREAFSYGIPGFRLEGRVLVWYAGWKAHWSVYPITAALQRAFRRDLKGYARARGTVRFPLDQPPSGTLLARLVRARAREVRSMKSR